MLRGRGQRGGGGYEFWERDWSLLTQIIMILVNQLLLLGARESVHKIRFSIFSTSCTDLLLDSFDNVFGCILVPGMKKLRTRFLFKDSVLLVKSLLKSQVLNFETLTSLIYNSELSRSVSM